MKQQFGLIRRPWSVYYLKNKTTGEQTSLKTSDKAEAQHLLTRKPFVRFDEKRRGEREMTNSDKFESLKHFAYSTW